MLRSNQRNPEPRQQAGTDRFESNNLPQQWSDQSDGLDALLTSLDADKLAGMRERNQNRIE